MKEQKSQDAMKELSEKYLTKSNISFKDQALDAVDVIKKFCRKSRFHQK